MDLPCQRLTEFFFSPNGMAKEEGEEKTEKDTVQLSYNIINIKRSR